MWTPGNRRDHWRIAESADDSAGIGYGAISERAWQRMETTKSPRYYFDLRKERKSAAKAETAYTPGLLFLLDWRRRLITCVRWGRQSCGGRDALVANAELCAGDDSRRRRSAGPEVILAELSGGRPDGGCGAGGADSTAICKRFRDEFGAL